MSASGSDLLVAVVTSIGSSGILSGILLYATERGKRKKEEAKEAEAEQLRLERARELREEVTSREREMLNKAYREAQLGAFEANEERYKNLKSDYEELKRNNKECLDGVRELRDVLWQQLNVFEGVILRMQPTPTDPETYIATMPLSELGEARRAINEARRHLR